MTAEPQFMTQEELAQLLRVSIHAVRKWRQAGRIPYVRINKTILFSHADVAAFVEKHRYPQVPA